MGQYTPNNPPTNASLDDVIQWVKGELEKIASASTETAVLKLEVLHVAPKKPREGMLAFADGSDWNPGSGRGPYANISGTWTKLFP